MLGVADPSAGGDPPLTWEWNFGDGTPPFTGAGTIYQNPKYTYPVPGTYTITYRVATTCNIWSNYRTQVITVTAPIGGVTINAVSNANYGDIITLSGTDTTGGSLVHLQLEGPQTPMGTKIADVQVQGGVWSYPWDTSLLPVPGSYSIWVFSEQFLQNDAVSITLAVIVTPMYGRIEVTSVPSGTSVFLDGNYKGTTPLTLTSISPGTYQVRLETSGYSDYSTSVMVSAGQTATVSATLTPITTTGSLVVSSSPVGANVFVDGIIRGITPLTLSSVPTGSHTLLLTMNGYANYSSMVTVSAGQTATVSATLSPLITTGSLVIASSPVGANIFLDGTMKGITPLTISTVPIGTHTVRLTMNGYQDYTLSLTIHAGKTVTVNGILSPLGASSPVGTTPGVPTASPSLGTTSPVPTRTLPPPPTTAPGLEYSLAFLAIGIVLLWLRRT